MKCSKTLFLSLITVLFLLSCSKDDNDSNTGNDLDGCTSSLPFFKDGALFVYKNIYSAYIPADTLYQTFSQIAKNQFKIINKYDEGITLPIAETYMGVCEKKVYSATKSDFSDAVLMFDLGGNVGDKWTYQQKSTGSNIITITYEIISKSKSKTVKAGTFDCIFLGMKAVSSAPGSIPVEGDYYYSLSDGLILADVTTAYYELARKN